MKHFLKTKLWFGILLIFLISQVAVSEKKLSDIQKKEIVYQMYAQYKKNIFPSVKDISPHQAMEMMQSEQLIFIDTRKPAEMKISMLPNALTKEEFLKNPLKYKDLTVVGYCTISYRSGIFAKEMESEGITIHNLTGGLLAWVLEGGKVYNANGEVKRIHVYGKKWNYPPEAYESVMFGFFNKYF